MCAYDRDSDSHGRECHALNNAALRSAGNLDLVHSCFQQDGQSLEVRTVPRKSGALDVEPQVQRLGRGAVNPEVFEDSDAVRVRGF